MNWTTQLRACLQWIAFPLRIPGQNPISALAGDSSSDLAQRTQTAPATIQSLVGNDVGANFDTLFLPALLYLLLPSAIVLFNFASWPIAVAAASAFAVVWEVAQSRAPQTQQWHLLPNTWPYLVLAAGVVWLSGAMPPFAENSDWHKHYALFNTLANQSWPPKIATGDGIATLRYSLSYYVLPAAAAKYFGPGILSFAIFAWTTVGLYLAMLLAFCWVARPVASMFLLACVFLLFSGADIVGTAYTGILHGPPMHFEWWWKPFGSLSSTITNLFWTPQHAIAGLLAVFLVLRYPQRSLRNAGVIAAAAAVWSPFVAIGLIPIFLWTIFKLGFGKLLSRSNLLCAPFVLVSAALFLTKDSGGIPAHFMWHIPGFTITGWLIFLFLEVGAIGLALLIVTPQRAPLIVLNVGFLVILALFYVGGANDLLMRASIPSLAILAALSAVAIAYAPNSLRKVPLAMCLVVGLVTPLGEIMRSLISPRILDKTTITIEDILSESKAYESQYIAYDKSDKSMKLETVLDLSKLRFSTFGDARFDQGRHLVESDKFTDAALVSDDISLPAGIYKLDVVFDSDAFAERADKNAGHLSLHGKKILMPIMSSTSVNKHVSLYFKVGKEPFKLSFGLGGWSRGKGRVELKELKISSVKK